MPATCGGSRSTTSTSATTAPASASAARLTLVAEITPAAVADLALRVGDDVWASVKATDVDLYAR